MSSVAPPQRALRFRHRGRTVTLDRFDPATTLLDWLRLDRRLTGTKEGCGEGDCGACTVALGRLRDGRVVYEPVNACILLLGQIDGCDLVTVEDLATGGALHPVQQALVDHHGSQCGFCTPGFVMSLFTLHHAPQDTPRDREAVLTRIAGNLCRCTGYRPIVEAGLEALAAPPTDAYAATAAERAAALAALDDGMDVFVGDEACFFAAPASLDRLAAIMAAHPDATLVGGATDVGLWITKQLLPLKKIVHTGRVAELMRIEMRDERLVLGAAVTYARAEASLAAFDLDLKLWSDRLGSAQVRASGTIGGNIANGSPIGDSPPVLIALGATLRLRRGAASREIPLEDFFLAYGRQDRAPEEIVTHVIVPKPAADIHFRAYKIAKRIDQDISAVMAGIALRVEARRVASARMAFGGVAGVPLRTRKTETACIGIDLDDPATWAPALATLEAEVTPIDDHRASARYRRRVARNLLQKALIEIAAGRRDETRVPTLQGAAHAA